MSEPAGTRDEKRCTAGQTERPDDCTWHHTHHWCVFCEGWYGVPHTRVHDGPNRHPQSPWEAEQCACRPCREYTQRDSS